MSKLMLVEDDNNLREIYEARLQAEGYTIVTARDGEEALVVAKAEKPDLIIADVMMPKISGFEMLDILRNTDGLKDVKVIMLTALGQSEDQQRADKLGADKYLVKSQVTLEDIVKTAHDLLSDTPPAPPAGDTTPTTPAPPAPTPTSPTPPVDPPAPAAPDPAPTPPPSADPPQSDPPAAPTDSKDAAQSTSQEEAGVEAKIEDFVTGATQDATAPSTDPTPTADPTVPAPEPASPSPNPAAPPAPLDTAAASDDKLMADAVQTLTASAAGDKADTVATPAPATAPASDQAKAPNTGSQRVITPIKVEDKKDINTLLAEEEAKEAIATPAASATVTPKPATDPSSIAL